MRLTCSLALGVVRTRGFDDLMTDLILNHCQFVTRGRDYILINAALRVDGGVVETIA